MHITIEELFTHSFVLTESKGRLQSFYATLKRHGLNFKPLPFEGRRVNRTSKEYLYNRHYMAAHFSHMQICKIAEEKNWPYVCIFEDDAYPCKDVYDKLKVYLNNIPDDALICRLGYVPYNGKMNSKGMEWKTINEDAFREKYTGGSHAYIIFRSFFRQNRLMMEKYDKEIFPLIAMKAMHNPMFYDANERRDVWFYEWLMAPHIYCHPWQSRIYSVSIIDNLFAQYDFIHWNKLSRLQFKYSLSLELRRKKNNHERHFTKFTFKIVA